MLAVRLRRIESCSRLRHGHRPSRQSQAGAVQGQAPSLQGQAPCLQGQAPASHRHTSPRL